MFRVNDVVLMSLLLTLPFSSVSIVDFEQVNISWVGGVEMLHLEQMSYYVFASN